MLLDHLRDDRVLGAPHRRGVLGAPARPDRHLPPAWRGHGHQLGQAPLAGRDAEIGEDDDRRLEALRAMDGHDPDFAGTGREVALHLRRRRADMMQEGGERGPVAALVIERGAQESVERVARLRAEPGERAAAAAAGAEQPGIETERSAAPRLLGEFGQPRLDRGIARLVLRRLAKGLAQRAAALRREAHEVVVA